MLEALSRRDRRRRGGRRAVGRGEARGRAPRSPPCGSGGRRSAAWRPSSWRRSPRPRPRRVSLALARRPAFGEAQVFRGTPLVLVADGVQNPGNLGGLLRTAEAAGATGAILTRGCADPFSWKALRGSMGSAFRLPHLRGLTIEEALAALRARGLAVLATAADGERRYDEADLRGPVALVVGSEGKGLAAGGAGGRRRPPARPARGARREPQRRGRGRARALRGGAPARLPARRGRG